MQQELAKAKSMDDFFGKEGILARLFADTLEQMLQADLSEHLGYEPHEAKGFAPVILPKGGASTTNELEDKIIGMYAKGMSVRDIQEQLNEL